MLIVAVNKCNITSYALQKLNEVLWGVKGKDVNPAILENYASNLVCDTVDINICYPDVCSNPTIVFTCNLNVTGISRTLVDEEFYDIEFTVAKTGGVAPFTYAWQFDTDVFFLNSPDLAQETLRLRTRPEFDLSTLVAFINVTLTDSQGCSDIQQSFLTPSGVDNSGTGLFCSNPIGLTVT